MLATEIKRETLTLLDESTDDVLTLAADAALVLGYDLLKDSLETSPKLPCLMRTLAELQIEILNKADVVTYMRERMCDRTLELLDQWQKDDPDPMRSWSSFNGPAWRVTPIGHYKQPIPEFVVNKALQIKRALPQAEIVIRHLTEDKDPFLEVTLNADEYNENKGERYFVEVWDEPKFEGRLR